MRVFYKVESAGISCTVFVEFGSWPDKDANKYADLLCEAEMNPGSACVKFASNSGDSNGTQ